MIIKKPITQTRWSSDLETLQDLHKILRNTHFLGFATRQSIDISMLKQWHSKIITAWNAIIRAKSTKEEKLKIKAISKKFKEIGKITKIIGAPGQQKCIIDNKKYQQYVNITSKLETTIVQVANDHNLLMSDRKYEADEDEHWS